ncbi:MAG: TetR/AcrR family transcriptional regulator [Chloroflexi bacterium HGW-Chloroflexi-8]|jgi:AcrR family transcriptional regulator|nr:MAG: TetR/AcrR family transcriptional regulator [Chloroflexi bacterium HGW-Chloroflexi-8]
MERQPDRRRLRTRKQLREALFELILENGYDLVTIEDITNRADLGRTTFYLHFKDKEQLLLQSIDEIANDLISQIDPSLIFFSSENLEYKRQNLILAPVKLVFKHASENANLYKIILRGEGAFKISNRFRSIINIAAAQIMAVRIKELEIDQPSLPIDVMGNFFAGTLLTLVTWWLENDLPYSIDEMANMVRELVLFGFSKQFPV